MKKAVRKFFSVIVSVFLLSSFGSCVGWNSKFKADLFTPESVVVFAKNGTISGKSIEVYENDLSTVYAKVELNTPEYSLSELEIEYLAGGEAVTLNEELTRLVNSEKFEDVLAEKGDLGEIYLAFTGEFLEEMNSKLEGSVVQCLNVDCVTDEEKNIRFSVCMLYTYTKPQRIEGSAPWLSEETPEE